jgi:hypothetical protein
MLIEGGDSILKIARWLSGNTHGLSNGVSECSSQLNGFNAVRRACDEGRKRTAVSARVHFL